MLENLFCGFPSPFNMLRMVESPSLMPNRWRLYISLRQASYLPIAVIKLLPKIFFSDCFRPQSRKEKPGRIKKNYRAKMKKISI
jgi:hypothetical protein